MKKYIQIAIALLCFTSYSAISQTFNVSQHLVNSAQGSASEALPYGVPGHWDWVAGATLNSLSAAAITFARGSILLGSPAAST